MASILKKPGAKAAAIQPSWHANFRNVEHLPDTKAVRTAFFGNGLAVLVAIVLVTYTVFKQYHLSTLERGVADWEQSIAANKPASDAAIADYQKFVAMDRKLLSAEGLLSTPLVFSDLILHLGSTLPPDVSLSAIDYRSTGVNLSGSVKGSPEKASGMVTDYLMQLRKDPVLSEIFDPIELTNMSRNLSVESISMELVLTFRDPKKKK